MAKLNYNTICQLYTLAEIEAEITYYQDIIKGTAGNKSYDKDTSQGRQRAETQDIQDVIPLLQAYLKAKACKLGLGNVNIVSQNFMGHN